METLVFEPLVPVRWLLAGWIALPAAVLAYALWRPPAVRRLGRLLLAAGHAAPFAALLGILHGPTLVSVRPKGRGRPPLLVLLDRSASMAAAAAPGESETRFERAGRIVRRHLPLWDPHFAVRIAAFDRTLRPAPFSAGAPPPPDGPVTDLAAAIDGGTAGGDPPAAILLLSDGIHNAPDADPFEAARRARAIGCPVYAMPVGSDAPVRDLGVELSEREGLTFVRKPHRLLATVTHRGFDDIEAALSVRVGGRVVDGRRLPIRPWEAPSADFLLVQERPGQYEYEIEVEARPGEAFASNNRQRFTLRVVDEKVRVLVLEGRPFWDTKFLVQGLRRDASVAATSIVRISEGRALCEGPPGETGRGLAPRDPLRPLEDRLFLDSHQVVVFGRDPAAFLSPEAIGHLKGWVSRRGGHLVFARGAPAAPPAGPQGSDRLGPLREILPAAWAEDEERRFRLELTERGRSLELFRSSKKGKAPAPPPDDDPRVILKDLPDLVTATRVVRERALAVVLARAKGAGPGAEMAAITFQPYGAGKVVVVEGQGLWRWAFQPPGGAAADRAVFESFWSNVVRWLAGSSEFLPSQSLSLRAGKPAYGVDEGPILYVFERAPPRDAAKGAPAPRPPVVVEVAREDGAKEAGGLAFPIRVEPAPVPGDETLKRAVLEPLPEGTYRVRLLAAPAAPAPAEPAVAAETVFEVFPPLAERLDLRARPEVLRRIAELSDGELLSAADAPRLVDRYVRWVSRFRPDLETRTPAWDRPGILLAILAWLALLWLARRRMGLV